MVTIEFLSKNPLPKILLSFLAGCEGQPEIPEAMQRERGRLETIRRLTGGNPRLLVLACRMLIESPLGSAKLSSSHASAQLRQFVEKGHAREVRHETLNT